jgi:hypothetical protein
MCARFSERMRARFHRADARFDRADVRSVMQPRGHVHCTASVLGNDEQPRSASYLRTLYLRPGSPPGGSRGGGMLRRRAEHRGDGRHRETRRRQRGVHDPSRRLRVARAVRRSRTTVAPSSARAERWCAAVEESGDPALAHPTSSHGAFTRSSSPRTREVATILATRTARSSATPPQDWTRAPRAVS